MNNEHDMLCSTGFKKLYSALITELDDPFKLADIFKENYHYIADEIPIAKILLHVDAPKTILESDSSKNHDINIILCSDENEISNEYLEFNHHTGNNGLAKIAIYPYKNFKWNEKYSNNIDFLEQVLFTLFGRARLGSIMSKAMVSDFLTGAANIKGFNAFVRILTENGHISEYASIFLNIKNFNYINRTVGAKEGDNILKQYVAAITGILDPDKEIIARLGGDNFVILVRKENIESLLDFIECVIIKSSFNNYKQAFEIRCRAGIYFIKDNQSGIDVVNHANIAYQHTRKSGNDDFVWFQESMLDGSLKSKEVSAAFPQAMASREFVVFYQPKVTLYNNHLCGCEALVRWFRNDKIVPPIEFIPILEREGSIIELDFYVLEQVCMDINSWLKKGMKPLCVSVNFSKAHLRHSDFAKRIIDILEKYNIDSKYIEVELTESSSHEDCDVLRKFIHVMKTNGISTSIDDFGTGYSSLNLLKDIDVDIIKLDKSFLDNLNGDNRTDEIVIKHIVGLVSDLNMNIIAEGVETSGQADFLRSVHCDMAQGYLFDKPLPREEFEKRLLNGAYKI